MGNRISTTKHPIYKRWWHMIQRCHNPKHKNFNLYGGRGITVCDRWKNSFFDYLQDVGLPPFKSAQIDRKENNGNYEPGNFQWVTSSRNNRNRKNNRILTHEGETMCMADWADKLGLGIKTLMSRFNMGWPIEEILNPEKRNRWSRKKRDF